MLVHLNNFEQLVGQSLTEWTTAKMPERIAFTGKFCRLEPLNVEMHIEELYEAFKDSDDSNWTYLPYGPFVSFSEYYKFLTSMEESNDLLCYTVIERTTNKAVGTVCLMRIDAQNGSIEIGHVVYSVRMQRTTLSTEVMALLQNYIFEKLGYRRLEWKCDSLNEPSRTAAERFGFTFEGVFRQSQVIKGRNRDTAWYSLLDHEYSRLETAYRIWLSPSNFDESGQQLNKLRNLIDNKNNLAL